MATIHYLDNGIKKPMHPHLDGLNKQLASNKEEMKALGEVVARKRKLLRRWQILTVLSWCLLILEIYGKLAIR